jgi:GntR family transcriptional regulator / MocR family aminotransferase
MASEELTPMGIVSGIYRYPVKGLSPQPVEVVELEAGRPFPFDRVFALARPGAPIDSENPGWANKGLFLMLMRDEALASVQTWLDPDTLQFSVRRRHASPRAEGSSIAEPVLSVDLKTREGRAAVEAFFREQVPRLEALPRLVRSPEGHFMDKPDNVVSCVNLATLRSLEAEWGVALHPLRFRANFYIDGVPPWQEVDWLGGDILLGDVVFRVDRKNARCAATNVDPVTGERDMDIPESLRARFGHNDLGVYLVARTSGRVAVGDAVRPPTAEPPEPGA